MTATARSAASVLGAAAIASAAAMGGLAISADDASHENIPAATPASSARECYARARTEIDTETDPVVAAQPSSGTADRILATEPVGEDLSRVSIALGASAHPVVRDPGQATELPVFHAVDDMTDEPVDVAVVRPPGAQESYGLTILRAEGYREMSLLLDDRWKGSEDPIAVRLTRLGRLEGTVRCRMTGAPIVCAEVEVEATGSCARTFINTGTLGRYRMEGLERDSYAIEVSAPGFFSAERHVDAGGPWIDDRGVDFTLEPCARIVGCVRSASRKRLPGVSVRAVGAGRVVTDETDGRGVYRLEANLHPGRYTVTAVGGEGVEVDARVGEPVAADLVAPEPPQKKWAYPHARISTLRALPR